MPSRSPIQLLLTFFVALAGFAFVYGIGKACYISYYQYPVSTMPDFLSDLVISISVVLATNFGFVVGFTVRVQGSSFRNKYNWNPLSLISGDTPTVLQTSACYLYLFGLIAAALCWGYQDFTEVPNRIVPLLPQLTKSLVGVVVGALAQALGSPRT